MSYIRVTRKHGAMNHIYITLFYKFTDIDNPAELSSTLREFCGSQGLLGKILVAQEGINGSLSGSEEQIEAFKKYLTGIPSFSDIAFKDETGTFHPFKKLIIRIKNEIIRMERKLDMSKRGKYISPEELLEMYSTGEDFIILDTRNNYESDVGRFKNAITPDIDSFREFPKALEILEDRKDKKIITYCTGGIRCEKATSYMVSRGFTDVYQLKDGIINFCQQHPNTVWEGKCFVFDQRLISDIEPESETISVCVNCGSNCDRYCNCKNPTCDGLIILCVSCSEELSGCCSVKCAREYKNHISQKSRERQGYKTKEVT